jgi:hypothetical protein
MSEGSSGSAVSGTVIDPVDAPRRRAPDTLCAWNVREHYWGTPMMLTHNHSPCVKELQRPQAVQSDSASRCEPRTTEVDPALT